MAVTTIPNVTNWSVTPQNGQANYFTLMNTWLSESTTVIASLQAAITAQNTANSEINTLAEQTATNAQDAQDARDEAVSALALLSAGAIDDTIIATNKAFSNSYIQANYYDKTGIDTNIYTKEQMNNILLSVIPAGTVIHFAGSTVPAGFLELNGAELSRTVYADLFAVVGTIGGAGDGSTTFNLPDARGEFIRGWDHGRGVDTGRSLGSSQLDAMQGHIHRMSRQINNSNIGDGTVIKGTLSNSTSFAQAENFTYEPSSDGINGTPRIASETRPRNIAMMYCIKY